LAVFQGGFSREAAQSVAGASLRHLAALADRSLIRRVASGRYDLHELLKQYAAEKLDLTPAVKTETLNRHSKTYLAWVAREGEELKGPRLVDVAAEFQRENANIRAAWLRGVEMDDFASLIAALPAVILIHDMRGVKRDGLVMVEALLARLEHGDPSPELNALRAFALAARRHLGLGYRDLAAEQPDQIDSLRLARLLPDCHEKASVYMLSGLGPSTVQNGRQALELCLESRAIFDLLGDPWGAALASEVAGDTAMFGCRDLDLAQRLYTQSLEEFKRMGNAWGMMLATNGLGYLAQSEDRLDDAVALFTQTLSFFIDLGDAARMVDLRIILANLYLRLEDKASALELLRANHDFFTRAGVRPMAERTAAEMRRIEPASI
jgi:tetratricopeptide (TPR) repeat protein